MARAGHTETAVAVTVDKLKITAVAKGLDIDHGLSALFRHRARVVILVEMALQVEERQRADRDED